jgi:hypothetical protein
MSQWWAGLAYGVFAGYGLGYLNWRLPQDVARFQSWRQRRMEIKPKIRAEIERIEGGFRVEGYVPNRPPRPPFMERIVDAVQEFWRATAPSSPEEHATRVYKELAGLA